MLLASEVDDETVAEISDIDSQLFDETYIWPKEAIEKNLKNIFKLTFVCKNDEELIGYIITSAHYDKEKKRNTIVIESIAVKSEYQNQGIGKNLLSKVIKKWNIGEDAFIVLLVNKDNVQARKFYESLGFEACEDYSIADYDDDITMGVKQSVLMEFLNKKAQSKR
jgi:ribosomal protein S18 acetylase RimI-like enzyme